MALKPDGSSTGTTAVFFPHYEQILTYPIPDGLGSIYQPSTRSLAKLTDGKLDWQVDFDDGTGSDTGSIAWNGVVIGLEDGQLVFVDSKGKQRWSVPTNGEIVRMRPIIWHDIAVIGNKTGRVVAVDKDGATVWALETTDDLTQYGR